MREKVNVALLGLGTVGCGVVKLLLQNRESIARRAGCSIEVSRILVKDLEKKREIDLPAGILTTDPQVVFDDEDIDVVIEVMGGISPAKDFVIEALRHGKNVVTANKDLLSLYGEEVLSAADKAGKDLFFEASVGGGIPIIHPLKECLAGNRIQEVMGIINGTTNYILTRMAALKIPLEEALKEAQTLGYAEQDPRSDLEGLDAARKVAILASIAFSSRVTLHDVYVEGIMGITSYDLDYAYELGYTVKLLGIARESEGEVEARVHPVFIPKNHPLAAVNDEFNAIFVRGDAVGETMFYGRGAGQMPTASAVVGDLIEVARDINHNVTGRLSCTCFDKKPIRDMGRVISRFYVRLTVLDRPGVLAGIATVLGNQEVSLASVVQKRTSGHKAEIVLITHEVTEQNMRDALSIIQGLSSVLAVDSLIRVEGGM